MIHELPHLVLMENCCFSGMEQGEEQHVHPCLAMADYICSLQLCAPQADLAQPWGQDVLGSQSVCKVRGFVSHCNSTVTPRKGTVKVVSSSEKEYS